MPEKKDHLHELIAADEAGTVLDAEAPVAGDAAAAAEGTDAKPEHVEHTPIAPADRPVRKIGYLFGLLAAFLYCSQGPVTKILLQQGYTSFDITALLFVLGAIVINIYVLGRREFEVYQEGKRHPFVFLIMGTAFFVSYLMYFMALRHLNVGVAAVLFYLSPVIIVCFFMVTKIKHVTRMNKLAALVAIIGCMFALNVFTKESTVGVTLIGVIFSMTGAACGATGNLVADLKAHDIGAMTMVLYNTTIGAILAVIIKPSIIPMMFHMTWQALVIFLLLAVFTKLLPAACFYAEIKCIGTERASVVATTETPMTLVLSYFLLGETMLPIQLIGVGCVLVAVLLLQKKE